MFPQKDFDIDLVLKKPLMAHLSTVANGEPRDSPNAYLFYKKLGYIEMLFNNPDGEPTHPDDRAMGKYL